MGMKIKVAIENDAGREVVTVDSDNVLEHHEMDVIWESLGDTERMSLAEDYALWSEKRMFGDFQDYRVDVVGEI